MRILVTGATGFIGRVLCEELVQQKHEVVAVVRKESAELGDSTETISLTTIDQNTEWTAALQNVDVVVHLAARVHVLRDDAIDPLAEYRQVNVDGTLNLAKQAVKAGVKRFIFMSSVKVNGESTAIDKPFKFSDEVHPQDAYGISKLEAEKGLVKVTQSSGMEVVIIRPPLIYGDGVKANFAKCLNS